MLNDIGHESIQLMTNNPDKVEQLEKYGINVVNRVEHKAGLPENREYYEQRRFECAIFYQFEDDTYGRSHFDSGQAHTGRGEEGEQRFDWRGAPFFLTMRATFSRVQHSMDLVNCLLLAKDGSPTCKRGCLTFKEQHSCLFQQDAKSSESARVRGVSRPVQEGNGGIAVPTSRRSERVVANKFLVPVHLGMFPKSSLIGPDNRTITSTTGCSAHVVTLLESSRVFICHRRNRLMWDSLLHGWTYWA